MTRRHIFLGMLASTGLFTVANYVEVGQAVSPAAGLQPRKLELHNWMKDPIRPRPRRQPVIGSAEL